MTTIMTPPNLITQPPVPRPVRWTCAEFHRFGDLGAFENRRAMLIDGVILEQGPMNPPHATALLLVVEAIRVAFGAGWCIRPQLPLVFGKFTDPQPDIAVVPGGPRDYTGHPTDAALVIEVSDTSLGFDTNEKRRLYAEAGIREYWVVDINGRRLLVFRDPVAGDYASTRHFAPGDSLAPLAKPTANIAVSELFA